MNAPDVAYQVARQFTALRRRYFAIRLTTALSVAIGLMLAAWMVVATLDYYWEWSHRLRTSTMAVAGVIAGCGLGWQVASILRRSRQRPFAGIIERSFEDFGQRIRTVLDTVDGRVHGPQEMLTALGNQTLGRWESVSPSRMLPIRSLWSAVALCAAITLFMAGMFGSGGDWRQAMYRAIGSDLPYTRLEVAPGNVRLLEGTPVDVSLDLVGRTEREVVLRYRELRPVAGHETGKADTRSLAEPNQVIGDQAEWIESELLADEENAESVDRRKTFRTNLGKATWPIEYQFVSAGQVTSVYRIEIQPLIETERIEIQVQPPEYTGLQSRLFSKPELTVLERSDVTVTIELNHPLTDAVLETGPKLSNLQAIELDIPADRTRWTFRLPTDQATRWRFSGAGADGTPMEPVTGRLGIRRDSAPSLQWREPSDEIKVHTLAEVPLGVQVSDDYGIIEAGIAFQLGGEDEYVLAEWKAPSTKEFSSSINEGKTRLLLQELLPLESFELSERDYIAYYAYAIDNRPWGNHRTESDVRYIDIRPLRQFYQEIDPPAGNGGGSRVLVQLDEIIRRERFVINRTRNLVRTGTSMADQLGMIDRLVENQSELADLTRFLAEFFISRGNDDVEALSQAEATMLQAADSLAAGSLDLAMAQEQDALRSLAEARRTLEIALTKRMTAAQQQSLRRLASQLRQKLRRDRPETERELVDSLKQIAAEQRRVASQAQSVASMQSSGTGGQGMPSQDPQAENNSEPGVAAEPGEESESGEESEATENTKPDENVEPERGTKPDGEMTTEPSGSDPQSDPRETLFEKQIDLLERIEAIREQLSERLADSELMSRRMDNATAAMDELAGKAREGEFESLTKGGKEVSDQIDEIGAQLDAISAAEPVTRVSSLRDLTSGLSGMEYQLSQMNERSAGTESVGGDPPSDPSEKVGRLARRMAARSETLGEVIATQADVGDIEMSEVNDQLKNFAEQTGFLDKLDATAKASEGLRQADGKVDQQVSKEALERALEYAEAAKQLERLYQQLVTPRLARLRRMEQQASQLADQMGGSSGDEKNPETDRELKQLKTDLQEESLRELAEMLDGSGESDEQQDETVDGSRGGIAMRRQDVMANRVRLVADELRKRIQQVILLEIAVDRDTPIPSEYRQAVDGYFKTLAAENDSEMETSVSGGSL
ncbi:MAG: hypothetical protein KDB00_01810 [Planctomycetales bacterium]|nr:hypothetical protein [Planctomycetales bacterium]